MKEEKKKIEKKQTKPTKCNYTPEPSSCSVSPWAAAVPTQPNPPKFYGTAPCGVEYPFGQSEPAALAVPLPAPCALPAPQWPCKTRNRKGPDSASTSLQQWKHQCFISAIFILIKYRIIPSTMKRKNSLSAKTRTHSFLNSTKWSETIKKTKKLQNNLFFVIAVMKVSQAADLARSFWKIK